jgi:ABC-type enterochelin transport system permease subunit
MFAPPLAAVGNVIVTFGLLGFLGIIVQSLSDVNQGDND